MVLPYFRKDNIDLPHSGTDSFVISLHPIKGAFRDLKLFGNDIHFGYLDPSHELESKDNENIIGKNKLESSPKKEMDETVVLNLETKTYLVKKLSFFTGPKQKWSTIT